ncbi:mannonate dehydratase [Marinomonas posidonica]|uniref:Mannonate dehydratase n=1 Tax=Marinomonas posidonica (strain CECT 7376 / NCIMB 14433 / IVIA-Po-181) TaxID=491952 RepID=F6CYX6_MARPP|nr:mannonate dehydratase [Marinomonas posidonica]AEF53103.1 Mannonate dehydratase [Marinomonas posidonica IVIA-Po-181]
MEHTWRWFGVKDSISLQDIRQAGATGIVTALHDIPNGEVWPIESIQAVKEKIELAGLSWSVVESIPVHEDIKQRTGQYQHYIKNYAQSIQNLAECGIYTICYNFMPVLDWTRTDLTYTLPDGSKALRFDQVAFTAFDVFILKRANSESEYSEAEMLAARSYYDALTETQEKKLINTILAGLPGAEEAYTLDNFREVLAAYEKIDKATLRENFASFLEQIVPIAEACGVSLAVHPDDPPRPILGLPRIVSTKEDIEWLVKRIPSPANGITFCTGSYGVREDNDLCDMAATFAERIYFTHLRSTQREDTWGSFHEAAHLEGNTDISAIILTLLEEEKRRGLAGIQKPIPLRPDHGHQIMDDLRKQAKPGYSALGRMKGLAEIRGVEFALKKYVLKEESTQ